MFLLPENAHEFDFGEYSCVIDAVDTVTAKLEIIMRGEGKQRTGDQLHGAGSKLDPTKFQVTDLYKTTMCPLAKVMRREGKKKRNQETEGGLFTREADKTAGRYEHQLQIKLYLSAGDEAQVHAPSGYSRKCGLCAVCGGGSLRQARL